MARILLIICYLCNLLPNLQSQSLLDELNSDLKAVPDTIYTEATFKAPRLVNGQTIETVGKHGLNVIISHRFGNLNTGINEFYGLDQSHIRIGLEYGLSQKIDIGAGRSRDQKLVDGYFKIKLFRQCSGAKTVPVSVSLYSSVAIRTEPNSYANHAYTLANRTNYVNELLIARKLTSSLSIQLIPGFIHRNLTLTKNLPNSVYYTGFGGRLKMTQRVGLSIEYYHVWTFEVAKKYIDPLSMGFDIETGGHVFQLHFSNSRFMHEKAMIAENTNNWLKGDFGFGFNIIRHFNLTRKKVL